MWLPCSHVWVLMSIPCSRPQDSKWGVTYCRYNENGETKSFPSLQSPEARLDFQDSSRTLSQDNLPRHLSKCLDPIDLLLWPWRLWIITHVKWWLAQKLEMRESFSLSIWRSSFRTGVILASGSNEVTWEQLNKMLDDNLVINKGKVCLKMYLLSSGNVPVECGNQWSEGLSSIWTPAWLLRSLPNVWFCFLLSSAYWEVDSAGKVTVNSV